MTDRRRLHLLVFVFVFATCAWFYNGWGWNQTARLDAIWAFVEPGPNRWTVRIDDFLVDPEAGVNTGDWARNAEHGPHYYANKAPGTTLLGIPFYFGLYHVERLVGVDPLGVGAVLVNAYLIHLWVTVLPVALSAVFFLGLLGRLGLPPPRALPVTGLLYAGTLLLPFSTMMWGHTTAAAFVVMSLACFLSTRPSGWLASGLLAGVAVLTDYGAAPFAAGLVAASLLVPAWRERATRVVLGGAPALAALLGYHGLLFGEPFRLASSFSPGEMLTERYLLGLFGLPRLDALLGLLVSTSRGVFVFMPVLLGAVVGVRHLRGHDDEAVGWLALFCVVAALLSNASFNAWQGGVSTGPRYLIWSLPLWVVLLAFVPGVRRVGGGGDAGAIGSGVTSAGVRRTHVALGVLGALAVANMVAIAAVSPMAPDARWGSPLFFVWSELVGVARIDLGLDPTPPPVGSLSRGSLHLYPTVPLRDWGLDARDPRLARWASFNAGERLFGLRGVLSILPLLVLGAALGGAALRVARRLEGRTAPADDLGPNAA